MYLLSRVDTVTVRNEYTTVAGMNPHHLPPPLITQLRPEKHRDVTVHHHKQLCSPHEWSQHIATPSRRAFRIKLAQLTRVPAPALASRRCRSCAACGDLLVPPEPAARPRMLHTTLSPVSAANRIIPTQACVNKRTASMGRPRACMGDHWCTPISQPRSVPRSNASMPTPCRSGRR